MKKIAVFAGSTSSKSINKKLAIFSAQQLQNTLFEILDLNNYEVPIFSEDFESENDYPIGAESFNSTLDKYDGFIVSLAEHNGSYAVAFKNLLDWVSRKNREVFRKKPVLIMATSPGGRGGVGVLELAKTTFPHLGADIVGTYSLSKFYEVFEDHGIADANKLIELKNILLKFEQSL